MDLEIFSESGKKIGTLRDKEPEGCGWLYFILAVLGIGGSIFIWPALFMTNEPQVTYFFLGVLIIFLIISIIIMLIFLKNQSFFYSWITISGICTVGTAIFMTIHALITGEENIMSLFLLMLLVSFFASVGVGLIGALIVWLINMFKGNE